MKKYSVKYDIMRVFVREDFKKDLIGGTRSSSRTLALHVWFHWPSTCIHFKKLQNLQGKKVAIYGAKFSADIGDIFLLFPGLCNQKMILVPNSVADLYTSTLSTSGNFCKPINLLVFSFQVHMGVGYGRKFKTRVYFLKRWIQNVRV
jgi:hypothetical protein